MIILSPHKTVHQHFANVWPKTLWAEVCLSINCVSDLLFMFFSKLDSLGVHRTCCVLHAEALSCQVMERMQTESSQRTEEFWSRDSQTWVVCSFKELNTAKVPLMLFLALVTKYILVCCIEYTNGVNTPVSWVPCTVFTVCFTRVQRSRFDSQPSIPVPYWLETRNSKATVWSWQPYLCSYFSLSVCDVRLSACLSVEPPSPPLAETSSSRNFKQLFLNKHFSPLFWLLHFSAFLGVHAILSISQILVKIFSTQNIFHPNFFTFAFSGIHAILTTFLILVKKKHHHQENQTAPLPAGSAPSWVQQGATQCHQASWFFHGFWVGVFFLQTWNEMSELVGKSKDLRIAN